jgi:hypothetical protein
MITAVARRAVVIFAIDAITLGNRMRQTEVGGNAAVNSTYTVYVHMNTVYTSLAVIYFTYRTVLTLNSVNRTNCR